MKEPKKRTINEIRQTKDSVYENPTKTEDVNSCDTSMMLDAEKFIERNYSSLKEKLTSSQFSEVISALVRYKDNY
jgi:hypothetical protein